MGKRGSTSGSKNIPSKRIRVSEDKENLKFGIEDICSTIFGMSLICRIKSIGNYRSVMLRSGSDEVAKKPDDQGDKMFSFTALDGNNNTVRVTAFKETADLCYKIIKVGQIFKLAHFYVRPTPRTASDDDFSFELEIREDTTIEPVDDIVTFAVLAPETFVPMSKIKTLQDNARCSIKGEITECGDRSTQTSQRGVIYDRQDITVSDNTKEMQFGLWGPCLEGNQLLVGQNVIIRNLQMRTFRGTKQASVQYDTTVEILKT